MLVWENSIGNINPPTFVKGGEKNIFLIYLVWYVNQFYVLIILLNFLIAVISQSYENVMNRAVEFQYLNKSSLSREAYQVTSVFSKHKTKINVILLTLMDESHQTHAEDTQWRGFVQTVKTFINKKFVGHDKSMKDHME